ncbi:MAG: AI-2E family transporter [Microthrixaceae bacterium]
MRAVLIIGAFAAVATLAVRAAHPLVAFLEAAVIAALARPVVMRLARRMPAWCAVLAVTAVAIGALATLGAVGFGELRSESTRFADRAPAAARELESRPGLGSVLGDLRFSEQIDRAAARAAGAFDLGGRDLPGIATAVGGRLSSAFIVWVLAVMLVFTGPAMVDGALGLLRSDHRTIADDVLGRAYGATLRYLGWTSVRALVAGAAVFVVASAAGIDMPALLAVVAALLAYVPRVGIVLGILPVALVGLLDSSALAVVALGLGIGLQLVDVLVVQPRITARSTEVGMLITLVALALGFTLYGVAGVFVGLTIACMIVGAVTELGRLQDAEA